MHFVIFQLEEFDQAHVHIKNKSEVQEKLRKLLSGGASSLQVSVHVLFSYCLYELLTKIIAKDWYCLPSGEGL